MGRTERQLPSGLWVAEDVPPEALPAAPPKPEPWRCTKCGKEGARSWPAFASHLDGFYVERPTCRHGELVVCKDCLREVDCPVCGCTEFYT